MVQRPIRTTPKGTILERNIRPCGNKYLQIQETKMLDCSQEIIFREKENKKHHLKSSIFFQTYFSIKKKPSQPFQKSSLKKKQTNHHHLPKPQQMSRPQTRPDLHVELLTCHICKHRRQGFQLQKPQVETKC